jgi:hypothetical protein
MVSLDVGGTPLLARITQRSTKVLGLKPGLALFAQITGRGYFGVRFGGAELMGLKNGLCILSLACKEFTHPMHGTVWLHKDP